MLGDQHLANLIPKFLRNCHHYPELSVFNQFKYHFDNDLKLKDIQGHLLKMFKIYDHVPQVIVTVAGGNNIAKCSKAQARARSEDMITDCVGLWTKAIPEPKMKLGLFVSLVPSCLWYQGFLDQKVAREARRSLNSHIGKVAKLLQATVITHPYLETQEKWFHQLREDPIILSEPGYDLILQDLCLTVVNYSLSPLKSSA